MLKTRCYLIVISKSVAQKSACLDLNSLILAPKCCWDIRYPVESHDLRGIYIFCFEIIVPEIGKCDRPKRGRNSCSRSQLEQFGSIRLRCRDVVYSVARSYSSTHASNVCISRRVWVPYNERITERRRPRRGIGQQQNNDTVSKLLWKMHFLMMITKLNTELSSES